MKHLLISLITVCLLFLGCTEQKNDQAIQVELKAVFEDNLKSYKLATGWYPIIEKDNGFNRQLDKTDEFYFIDPNPILIKSHFDKLEVYETENPNIPANYKFAISIKTHTDYEKLWSNATETSVGKRLALIIDNKLLSTPMVQGKIESGMSSLDRGVYSKEELENFIKQIAE